MEQGAGYAGGDGNQFPLAAEDFDLAGAGELGEIDGASAADAGDGGFVGGDRWKVGKQLAGGDEESLQIGSGRDTSFPNPRVLHSPSLSLRENRPPVGVTV